MCGVSFGKIKLKLIKQCAIKYKNNKYGKKAKHLSKGFGIILFKTKNK